ncbi:MAG TPA: serine/threonine-protein kinase [Ktedonobacterales bacterium]|nr:serine/threonine-protein kinase [Ktedonobacterales bacterium]
MAGAGGLIGQRIGPYVLQGLLGTGGMGAVYRARDMRLGRAVAIKVIDVSVGNGPRFAARFQREARALAQLDHPNILPLWDVGQVGHLLYLVTPVVEGGSLRDLRLRLGGSVPPKQAFGLAIQVADALQHAHERGIIHRDVKPGNLLLHPDGRIMLADFGIARSLHDGAEISATDLAIGTPHYIAPEQALGDQVDGRADVYSLGAVLYELLSGRPPYLAESATRVLVQVLDGPPPPLLQVNSSLSLAVQTVVMHALVSQPDQRYATAGAFAADMRRVLELGLFFAGQSLSGPALPRVTRQLPRSPVASLSQPPAGQMASAPAVPPARPLVGEKMMPAGPAPAPDRPTWKPVPKEPPPAPRSLRLAVVMTILVILFLGGVIATALIINR